MDADSTVCHNGCAYRTALPMYYSPGTFRLCIHLCVFAETITFCTLVAADGQAPQHVAGPFFSSWALKNLPRTLRVTIGHKIVRGAAHGGGPAACEARNLDKQRLLLDIVVAPQHCHHVCSQSQEFFMLIRINKKKELPTAAIIKYT